MSDIQFADLPLSIVRAMIRELGVPTGGDTAGNVKLAIDKVAQKSGSHFLPLLQACMSSTSPVNRMGAIRLYALTFPDPKEAVVVFRRAMTAAAASPHSPLSPDEVRESGVPAMPSPLVDDGSLQGAAGQSVAGPSAGRPTRPHRPSAWSDDDKVTAARILVQLIRPGDASIYDVLTFMLELHDSTRNTGVQARLIEAIDGAWSKWRNKEFDREKIHIDLYQQGNALHEADEYRQAILLYSISIMFYPTMSECYFNRALSYYYLADYDRSLVDYDQAVTLDPRNPIIYNNRGDVYYRKGKFASAIVDYKQAIRLNPKYDKALYNAGLSCTSKEDYKEAVEYFTKVIDLKPGFAEAFHLRGISNEYDDRLPEAIRDYEKALELDPRLREAAEHLEAARQKLGKKESEDDSRVWERMMERPSATFNDVVGMIKVKEEIRSTLIAPLANPDLARLYGIPISGGILLYGPPGCGKTFIARAAAGEAKAAFYHIDLTVQSKWVGETEKNLRFIFEHAVEHAPAIIFIDEIDGLAAARDEGMIQSGWERKLVNQLLIEMSRLEDPAHRVPLLVIGATNQPWLVDKAIRRAGRIGWDIYVPGPDRDSRIVLFRHFLRDKPTEAIDHEVLADRSDGQSAARIKDICERAARPSWEEAERTKVNNPITMDHLLEAIRSTEPDLAEWLKTASHYGVPTKSGMYRIGFKPGHEMRKL